MDRRPEIRCTYFTRKTGSLFCPTLFWVFTLTSCFLINVVESAASKSSSSSLNRMASLNEDNEFAEFEEFDEFAAGEAGGGENETPVESTTLNSADSSDQNASAAPEDDGEGVVEDEVEDDFDHLKDDAEFESFDSSAKKTTGGKKAGPQMTQLKITDVPAHLRNNWSNFQVELVVLLGLAIYLANYASGKAKNYRLATAWFEAHRDLLADSFEVVGDDGTTQEVQKNVLMKESDNVYCLWCSGRLGCQGALFQLSFLKRQDLVSLVMHLFKPRNDKMVVRFNLSADDLDTCILALGEKKSVAKLVKETTDLSQFCTERKSSDRMGLPGSFSLYAEMAETASALLDAKTLGVLTKYEDMIDYIHVSDQYSGLKVNEGETQTKLPETSRVVVFSFNMPSRGINASEQSMQDLKPLLTFAFYCVEKIRRFRLSREAKIKCDRNRLAAQESYLKQTHAQRQEAAQVRREEKARERKERVLAEEDPDKQRRLEKLEQKREMKKKQPKIKQLKIKAG